MNSFERDQQAFFDAVATAPGERLLGRNGASAAAGSLDLLVRGDDRATAEERLEIYRTMYFLRLRDSLAEDFPKVLATIGSESFDALIAEFLETHPPATPFLAEAGAGLPRFIDRHPIGRTQPWLGELADLDWARAAVFDAPDHGRLTLDALQQMPPEAFESLHLALVPACILVDVSWSVDDVWLAVEREGHAILPHRAPRRLVVWRRDYRILHRACTPEESEILSRLRGTGTTFGALCGWAAEERSPEEAARLVWRSLGSLIEAGLVRNPAQP